MILETISAIISLLCAFTFYNRYYNDVLSLAFLRPVSGNASLAMLNNIYTKYGVDSFSGILASLIQGANDTTIYILALYFSSIKIKKIRYALFVGLIADLCGVIAAYIVVKFFF